MIYALQEFGIPPTGTTPPVMKLKIDDAPTSPDKAEAALQSGAGPQPPTPAR